MIFRAPLDHHIHQLFGVATSKTHSLFDYMCALIFVPILVPFSPPTSILKVKLQSPFGSSGLERIGTKLVQKSLRVSKMSQSGLQKWSVWSGPSKVSWPFARTRSSQMDCETSRPQTSRPIRSSPLEPNGLRSFKLFGLESSPLEPATNAIYHFKTTTF